jgi:hypothetical protein
MVIAASVPQISDTLCQVKKVLFSLGNHQIFGVETGEIRLCSLPDKTRHRVAKIPRSATDGRGLCRVCCAAGLVSGWYGHCR